MILAAVACALLLSLAPVGLAVPGAHYLPHKGDQFAYTETIVVNNGVGNYTGYTEETYINGSVSLAAVPGNGTDTANYSNTDHFTDNSGTSYTYLSRGNFTFSSTTYRYVRGTDNQTGYNGSQVWFYMNNTLTDGATFYLLGTQMTVDSTNQSYPLATSPTGYVATIFAQGSGSYLRNDVYGRFTADFTWQSYFDPATGYIVGYLYTEQDRDGSGDGFTYTDLLFLTSSTYPLTPASPPPAAPAPSFWTPTVEAVVAVVVLLVVVIVVALLLRSRRRPSLPRHSTQGAVNFVPPSGISPGALAPGGVPPPIRLTPGGQPAVQQIVIKETVKVNCRYCGALIDTTDAICPNCGAPRT
jgi:hypothetical protein